MDGLDSAQAFFYGRLKMKVGVYVGDFKPDSGGGFRFANELLSALLKENFNHDLVLLLEKSSDTHAETSLRDEVKKYNLNCDVHTIQRSPIKNHRSLKVRAINRLLGLAVPSTHDESIEVKNDPIISSLDLIWFLTPHFKSFDTPYIATVWDLQHRKTPFFPEVSTLGWIWKDREAHFRKMLEKAAYILTPNEEGKTEVTHYYQIDKDRVKCIPHFTPSFILENSPKSLADAFQSDKSYIFYPAQFWPHKNHVLILDALFRLKNEHSIILRAKFTGSDQGNLNYVKNYAKKLGIENQIDFLGFVSTSELVNLYQNAWAMIYPSLFGIENIPPLEAMGLGCPVAVADLPCARLQFKQHAEYFQTESEEHLIELILKWIRSPSARTERVFGASDFARSLTSEGYILEIKKILEEFSHLRNTWPKYVEK